MSEKSPWKCPSCGKTRLLPVNYSAAVCVECRKRTVKADPQKAVPQQEKVSVAGTVIQPKLVSATPNTVGQQPRKSSARFLVSIFAILVVAQFLAFAVWIGFFRDIKSELAKQEVQPAPQAVNPVPNLPNPKPEAAPPIAKIKSLVRQYLSETLNDPDFKEVKWSEPVSQLSRTAALELDKANDIVSSVRWQDNKAALTAAQAIIDDAPRRKAATVSIRLKFRQKMFGNLMLSDYVFTIVDGKVIEASEMSVAPGYTGFMWYDPRHHFYQQDLKESSEKPIRMPPADLGRVLR